MKKSYRNLLLLLGAIPFLAGILGYHAAHLNWGDAAYSSFVLYFANPIRDEINGAVIFARWFAPFTTMTAAAVFLKSVWKSFGWFLDSLSAKNVVVYEDDGTRISFSNHIKADYPGDRFVKGFREQIILFSTDEKCLEFYQQYKKELKNRNVYLGLHDLESGFLKGMDQVTLFDVNRSIARLLWKMIALWNRPQQTTVNIAIYGNGGLARQVLATGLQLNLLSTGQKITYHMITDDRSFERRHQNMNLMNGDEIIYHRTDSDEAWAAIRNCNYVIVAERPDSNLLQNVIVNTQGTVSTSSSFSY